jgi:lipopolysaccharide transport system permease protein
MQATEGRMKEIAPDPSVNAVKIVIRPTRGVASLDLLSLWEYRELIYFMVLKDLKTRYKQTALGVGWAILQPIMTMLIFTMIFAYFARLPSDGVPYPLFAFSALVPWTYFSQAVTRSGMGLVNNANLISKVYFPRLIVPLAAATSPLADLMLALGVLVGMLAWYGVTPPAVVIFLPVFACMAIAAALAIGLWLSALNVRYRDVGHLIPFVVQVGMFLSPVAYPVSLVPTQWQGIYALNPMVAVIEGFRWCLLGTPGPNLQMLVQGVLTILVFMLGGLMYFKATERTFADVV